MSAPHIILDNLPSLCISSLEICDTPFHISYFYISYSSFAFTERFISVAFNVFCMLLHIMLLLCLFHNIQLEWHCIAQLC